MLWYFFILIKKGNLSTLQVGNIREFSAPYTPLTVCSPHVRSSSTTCGTWLQQIYMTGLPWRRRLLSMVCATLYCWHPCPQLPLPRSSATMSPLRHTPPTFTAGVSSLESSRLVWWCFIAACLHLSALPSSDPCCSIHDLAVPWSVWHVSSSLAFFLCLTFQYQYCIVKAH